VRRSTMSLDELRERAYLMRLDVNLLHQQV
jgi:hypothetical protein